MPSSFLRIAALAIAVPVAAAQQTAPLVLSRLAWFDRAGERLETIGPLADYGNLELSPDGTRVAVAVAGRGETVRDIWIYDTRSGEGTQFTSAPADENWMIWSPDGERVALNSFADGSLDLLESPSRAFDRGAPLLSGVDGLWPVSWSPDGDSILYVTNTQSTGNDIWVLPLTGDRRPLAFRRTAAAENWASFSPDGRSVVFSSTQTGRAEVYVASFPDGKNVRRISADGGSQARWTSGGSEILYVAPDRTLIAAAIEDRDGGPAVSGYEPLFRLTFPYGAYHAFDVTRDGQRILANTLVVNPLTPGVIARVQPPPFPQ